MAEQTLGRPLAPGEIVHHENEVKADNAPENLRPMTNGEHKRMHNLKWWAERKVVAS